MEPVLLAFTLDPANILAGSWLKIRFAPLNARSPLIVNPLSAMKSPCGTSCRNLDPFMMARSDTFLVQSLLTNVNVPLGVVATSSFPVFLHL